MLILVNCTKTLAGDSRTFGNIVRCNEVFCLTANQHRKKPLACKGCLRMLNLLRCWTAWLRRKQNGAPRHSPPSRSSAAQGTIRSPPFAAKPSSFLLSLQNAQSMSMWIWGIDSTTAKEQLDPTGLQIRTPPAQHRRQPRQPNWRPQQPNAPKTSPEVHH